MPRRKNWDRISWEKIYYIYKIYNIFKAKSLLININGLGSEKCPPVRTSGPGQNLPSCTGTLKKYKILIKRIYIKKWKNFYGQKIQSLN